MNPRLFIVGLMTIGALCAKGWIMYIDYNLSSTKLTLEIKYSDEDEERTFDINFLKNSNGVYKCKSDNYSVKPLTSSIRFTKNEITNQFTNFLPFKPGEVYTPTESLSSTINWYIQLTGTDKNGLNLMDRVAEGSGLWQMTFTPVNNSITATIILAKYNSYDNEYDYYDFYYAKNSEPGNIDNLILTNSATIPSGVEATISGFNPGTEYTLLWDTYNERISIVSGGESDVNLKWLTEGVEADGAGSYNYSGINRVSNVITVGADNGLTEELASTIEYNVNYRATENEEYEEVSPVEIIDYTQIVLKKAGQYDISASLPGQNLENALRLTASITPLDITLTTSEGITHPFSNSMESVVYDGVFSALSNNEIENVSLILEPEDFNISVEPKFETISRPEIMTESLIPGYLWKQMMEIEEISQYQIDGFYVVCDTDDKAFVTINPDEYSVVVPHYSCSGKYEIKISPTDRSQVNFEEAIIPVEVYPNLYSYYGDGIGDNGVLDISLNINGIPISYNPGNGGYDYVINYPVMDYGEEIGNQLYNYDSLHSSILYTPGLYFPGENDGIYFWIDFKENNGPNKVKPLSDEENLSSNYSKYTGKIDLSGLGDVELNRNADIYLYVTKNGASTPYNSETGKTDQPISLVISNTEVPTGVKEIETGGPSQYYNLQGIEIQNPSPGLYLRKRGDKIEKIIIK